MKRNNTESSLEKRMMEQGAFVAVKDSGYPGEVPFTKHPYKKDGSSKEKDLTVFDEKPKRTFSPMFSVGRLSALLNTSVYKYSSENIIDYDVENAIVKSKGLQYDGAPPGNQNAAGPHKGKGGNTGRHVGKAEREKIKNRFVGTTTSQGTKITGVSDHAFDRLGGRLMSPGRMQKMLDSTDVKPDKTFPDRKLYDIPGSRMVVSDSGVIVTMMWRRR